MTTSPFRIGILLLPLLLGSACAHTAPSVGNQAPLSACRDVPPDGLEHDGGVKYPSFSHETLTAIRVTPSRKVIGIYRVCAGATGAVLSVEPVLSSGIPRYDQEAHDELMKGHYCPFDGDAPRCQNETLKTDTND